MMSGVSGGPLDVVEPDALAWDQFVERHPHGSLLQCSDWGTLKAASGWQVMRIGLQGCGGGKWSPTQSNLPRTLVSGAQVLFRMRYGMSVAYVPRGPLLSGNPTTDTHLLDALTRLARRRRAIFLRLEPPLLEGADGYEDPDMPDTPDVHQSDVFHSWMLCKGFQPAEPIQPRSTIHLDLSPPPEQLFATMSKGHRADIRRAGRAGVAVRVGEAGDIASFYAILHETSKRAAFAIHTKEYYHLAWSRFRERSRLLLAEQDGRAIAGHMVFADTRTGYYLYSGATEAGLKAGANHVLQWHAIQWAREQGCYRYDFWGIPDGLGRAATTPDPSWRGQHEAAAQNDPLMGVYRFKKGFGGTIVRYLPAYDLVFWPLLYTLWQRRLQ